jgi:hypothetical protein
VRLQVASPLENKSALSSLGLPGAGLLRWLLAGSSNSAAADLNKNDFWKRLRSVSEFACIFG